MSRRKKTGKCCSLAHLQRGPGLRALIPIACRIFHWRDVIKPSGSIALSIIRARLVETLYSLALIYIKHSNYSAALSSGRTTACIHPRVYAQTAVNDVSVIFCPGVFIAFAAA